MPLFEDRIYRPDEVAEILKIGQSTIYRRLCDPADPIPAFRLWRGGPLRINGAELNAYLESHKNDPLNEVQRG